MNTPKLPENVKFILDKLYESGYEGYIVGGCVRDAIMGILPHDWDITTSAKPEQVKEIFKHTFDTGIKHGTITVVLNKENYELTTYRIEGDYADCRHPDEVSFTTELHEDLLRRDFTMNAIAYNEKEGYVDIFDGIGDIERKLIKGVGEPDERFKEDALRMLRAVRFSTQLGFDIEEKTKQALIENGELIEKISIERIREEICKMLISKHTSKIALLWQTGLLGYISKEIDNSIKGHEEEVLKSLEICPKNVVVAFALFLRFVESSRVKYVMKEWRFDTNSLRTVDIICNEFGKKTPENLTEVRKCAAYIGSDNAMLSFKAKLCCGDNKAKEAEKMLEQVLENKHCISIKQLAVTGNDVKAAGDFKGEEIGIVLNKILDMVLEKPEINKKEILKKEIKKYADDKNKGI